MAEKVKKDHEASISAGMNQQVKKFTFLERPVTVENEYSMSSDNMDSIMSI